MHLNNLLIIPIPALYTPNNPQTQSIPPSTFKPLLKLTPINHKDDISWKKSFSAFKKFKPKRDKQAKLNNPLILPTATYPSQQPNSHHLLLQQKSFSLVDNEMDFSLLDNVDQWKITSQVEQNEKVNYYDPNAAPFFQYGVSYKYLPKENRVCKIECDYMQMIQEGSCCQLRRVESVKLRKQYTRKDNNINNSKSKSQNYFKITHHEDHHSQYQQQLERTHPIEHLVDNALQKKNSISEQPHNKQQLKSHKPYCSQVLLPQYRQKHYDNDDPFIIIKSTQKRQFTSSNESINTSKRGDQMKSRQIKKNTKNNNYNNINNPSSKPSNTSSVYSRSAYSDRKESSYSSQGSNNDDGSHDYGNNELQMIEFDLINHINPPFAQVKIEQNGLDNLPIFQVKDQSDKKKQLISNSNNKYNMDKADIIKQYDFQVEKQVELQ